MSDWKTRAIPADSNWKSRAVSAHEPSIAVTILDKLASGATAGFADEISGSLSVLGRAAGVDNLGGRFKDMGLSSEGPTMDLETLKQAYFQTRNQDRAIDQQQSESSPYISGASQLAGMIANPLNAATAGLGLLGQGATLGAAQGLGDSQSPTISGDALNTLMGAGLGTAGAAAGKYALQPAISAGAGALGNAASYIGNKVAGGGKNAAQVAGKVLTAVSPEQTSEYLARKGKVAAPAMDDILNNLTGHYDEAATELESAKNAFGQNKEALSTLKQSAQTAVSESKLALSDKIQQIRNALKSQDVLGIKAQVSEAMDLLKKNISKGSGESYQILDADPNSYSVRGAGKALKAMAEDMNIQPPDGMRQYLTSTAPITPETAAAQNKILGLAKLLENTPEAIPARELKKIIQQLDQSGNMNYGPGFDDRINKAYKLARSVIDDGIKTANPEYASKMAEVASNARLYDDLAAKLGTEDKIVSTLSGLGSAKGQEINSGLVKKLGSATGNDFKTPINNFFKAKESLQPEQFQNIVKGLPETEQLQKAYRLPEIEAAEGMLNKSQSALDAAQGKYDTFRSLSPGQVQGKVKSLTGARDYGPTEFFNKIDEATSQNYSQQIKDRSLLDSFDKGTTNGSRNALLYKAMGAAAGGVFGYNEGGAGGAAAGAMVGASADKYAGQVFKGILNSGIWTADTTRQLAPILGEKLTQALQSAAARGPSALSSTHFILQQQNTEYREKVKKMQEGQ